MLNAQRPEHASEAILQAVGPHDHAAVVRAELAARGTSSHLDLYALTDHPDADHRETYIGTAQDVLPAPTAGGGI